MTTEATTETPSDAPAPTPAPDNPVMTRTDLEAAGKPSYGFVTVGGKKVIFASLTDSQKCRIDATLYDENGDLIPEEVNNRRAKLMAATLCNAEGKRLYTDDEWEVVAKLNSKITTPIWEGVSKHLGLHKAEASDEKN